MSLLIAKVSESDSLIQQFSEDINSKSVLLMNQRSIYKKNLLVVDLNPTLPPIYLLGFVLVPLGFLFWKPLIFVGALFFLFAVFFWEGFHFWAMKKGLKKKGYKGEIERMKHDTVLRGMFFDSG